MTARGKWIVIGSVAGGVFLLATLLCAFGVYWMFGKPPTPSGHVSSAVSKRTCGTNLKILGTTMAIYAAQFNDQLPGSGVPGGSWMCDQPTSAWDMLGNQYTTMGTVPPKVTFASINYCPGNAHQDASTMWGGTGGAFRITGYVWTNQRSGMPSIPSTAPPAFDGPAPVDYHARFSAVRSASSAVFAEDWVVSDGAGKTWEGITAAGRPGTYDTSHMVGTLPEGGNVLAYDGHVEWRAFDLAKATPVPQSGGGPTFLFLGQR